MIPSVLIVHIQIYNNQIHTVIGICGTRHALE